jgi:hypothetical protein
VSDSEFKILAFIALGLLVLFIMIAGGVILRSRKQQAMTDTPVTEEGLTQYDDLTPGEAVLMAWTEAGNNPRWHTLRQDDVRAEMPVLARALDRLASNNF